MDDVDVNKILVSKKEPYGTKNALKYFIKYNDNDVIRLLCLRLPQMTGYVRTFDENATMYFRVNNKQLSKIYNKIWQNVEKLMRIDFESKPVYSDGDRYIKTKNIYMQAVRLQIFITKKMPKEKASCKFLLVIMIEPVVKANKKYYPQTFLEECKYVQAKIKTENYIDDDLDKSESDSDSNDETESDIDTNQYDE